MKSIVSCVVLAGVLACVPAPLSAQADKNAPPASQIKVRLGPVMMNPTVTFGDVGVDENVFNEATDPKRDFTMTISPKTEVWLRFLGTWFTGVIDEDIVWYQKYASERSGNTTYSLNWKLPLTRVTANVFASHASTRERPGYEIDERAKRSQNNYSAAIAVNVLTDTSLDFTTTRRVTDYDPTASFKSINLHDELNMTVTSMTVGLSRKLTPLTTLTLGVNRDHTRFPFNPDRDTNSTDASLAFRFDPVALLKGGLTVGYSKLSPLAPEKIPGFSGLTMAANLWYTLYDVTKFVLRADRVIQNSYDFTQPYYLQTGFNLEVAQQVLGRLDVVGRGGIENLNYRNRVDAIEVPPELADRTDRVTTYGAGMGYHLGRAMRIGISYDQTRRESVLESRRYRRPSIGTSITYDF